MEATGNQNVDLNSQLGAIVATPPHLQLNRNSILSPPPSLNCVVHPSLSFARFCESRISSLYDYFVYFVFSVLTCKPGWIRYKTFCYKVFDEPANFYQVNASCLSKEAEMVSIEVFDELRSLDTILEDGDKVFVGMTDIAEEGKWVRCGWMDVFPC